MEASPRSNVTTSSGKLSQNIGGCYSSKGGTNRINAHDFGMRCSRSRCPNIFGHVMYFQTLKSISFTTSNISIMDMRKIILKNGTQKHAVSCQL
jgi:hypothetical protein